MTTQYTPILKLALPVTGELSGTWGDIVNDNITSMVEQAIAGLATINTWTANSHTLTTASGTTSEARCAMLVAEDAAGLTAAGEIICPTAAKIYILQNNSTYALTLKTSAGTGVAVPAGYTMFVFCDGVNVVEAVTSVGTLKVGTGGVFVTTILDEDTLVSDSATALATQQSIKAYVDAQVTAQDLDFAGGTGTGSVDLDSQSFTIAGTANEIETSASGQTLTVGIPDAVTLGTPTFTNSPTINALTASQAVFTNGSKVLVSNAITGTGDVVMSTSPTLVTPALGTPASGVVTNLTGTASININGTVGATTPSTGSFTTLTTSSTVTHNGGTANGVAYLNGSKVLTTGSALTFDGTNLGATGKITAGSRAILEAPSWDTGYLAIRNTALAETAATSALFQSASGSTFLNSTTGNALYLGINGVPAVTVSSSGNLGLGVTPSAWVAIAKAIQVGPRASLWADSTQTILANNMYAGAGGDTYIASATAALYTQINGTHTWFTAPSGTAGNAITFTQTMTLDASGTLTVGGSPSGGAFEARADGGISSTFQSGVGGTVALGGVYAVSNGFVVSVAADNSRIYKWNTGTNVEAMTLDASGNLLVGSTSIIQDANNFVFSPGNAWGIFGHETGVASTTDYVKFYYGGGQIGSIYQSGTTSVVYSTTSDHRLKENVRPANAARFMDIEFVDFEWTDGRHDCGVIADQLQAVYPDLVLGEKDATEVRTVEITPAVAEVKDEDGNVVTPAVAAVTEDQVFPVYQQVNYTGLIGRMGTRVQQLQRTVDAQALLIAAMEARLTALEAQ